MKYKVTLNNRVYEVEVEEDSAMLVDEYEAKAPAAISSAPVSIQEKEPKDKSVVPSASNDFVPGEVVKSPMPGNILKILVSQGKQVQEGEVIIILEAMKMENEIVAPKTGTVVQLAVNKGQSVETGDPLAVVS